MYVGKPLFRDGELSETLHHELRQLRQIVEALCRELGAGVSDDQVASKVASQSQFQPLIVDFERVSKDVRPARVVVRDYGREIEVEGVQATLHFAFAGNSNLFFLKPNSYWSMLPYGYLRPGVIVVGIEDRNDPERIKRELDSQVDLLKRYVESQATQIEEHNRRLAEHALPIVQRHRQSLEQLDKLRSII